MNKDDNGGRFEDMSDDDFQAFLEADDDLPEAGPDAADHLFHDKYGIVWHCLYIEGTGWSWRAIGDSHE